MNESLLNRILKDHKRRTRSLALILCLSMIVSLGTFAGFHQTAIAKVYTREVLDCPYTYEGAEPVAHVHNDDCYEGETLVCTLPEREAHTHDDTCYAESRLLNCGLEENPGHQHSEACFDENGELICQIPEGEGAHSHTEECYTIERALVCNQPELPVHVHDAGCFRTEEISVDEPEEAIETEQTVSSVPEMPVSDPNADLETADDWNREFENLELSGNWARDLVLVAATQQGRGESPNNFEAVLNDAGDAWVRHGYTRYGAWYGYPYAEWDAMFVSFCLRYAGIPAENVPNNPTAALMAESISMGELFAGRDYVPAVGDLIFFDTVDDEITNIDHMGIVYHVDAENGTINTVEGDRTDAVATFGYTLDDEQIVGYGMLPQNPDYIPVEGENTDNTDEVFDGFIFMTTDEEEEKQEETTTAEEAPVPEVPMPAQSWERTAGGIKVTVDAPEGAFPENTRIAVTPVNGNSLKDTVSDAVSGEVLEVQAVDITFFDAEGREIEPAVPIRVVMTPAETQNAEEKANVVHIDLDQQTAEVIEQAAGTETDNSEVVFDADAFTIYAIVYTVHFEYEVDGETYTSASMPGAEYTSLEEVIRGLGIVSEEEVGTFVSKISTVASTNEDVAVVETTEDGLCVRVLKDGDAQIVITMQDGAQFRVDVVADGETTVENGTATVSTVGDLYLPSGAELKAEVLTEEQSESAIASVQEVEETADSSAATYQTFSIAMENVDVTEYEGFNVTVTLPEDKVVGRDFQLYQVKEDGTAIDLTESLSVSIESNEDGLQNISGFSFTTEDFADFVLSYSIETFYTTASGDRFKITLNYGPRAEIPEDAELKVTEILPEDETYSNYLDDSAAKLGVNTGDLSFARFFDIEIQKDGEKIEPKAPIQVTISLADTPEEAVPEGLKVLHFAQTGLETINETQSEQKEDETIDLSFVTNGFSVYGVVYTVDFHYEVNGKVYEFSIPGGGFVSFEKLAELLGIAHDSTQEEKTANAKESTDAEAADLNRIPVSEATRQFVANVASVEFSNPELVWVGYMETETTVGVLKEANSLEILYSADLTEEKITEINEQTLEAGDWALISLKPFDSEELLTITMKNGDVVTVKVTDAQNNWHVDINLYDYNGSSPATAEELALISGKTYAVVAVISDKTTNQVLGYRVSGASFAENASTTSCDIGLDAFKTLGINAYDGKLEDTNGQTFAYNPEQHNISIRLYEGTTSVEQWPYQNYRTISALPAYANGFQFLESPNGNVQNDDTMTTSLNMKRAYDKQFVIRLNVDPAGLEISEDDRYYAFVTVDHETTGTTYAYAPVTVSAGQTTVDIPVTDWYDQNGNPLPNEKFTGNETVNVKLYTTNKDGNGNKTAFNSLNEIKNSQVKVLVAEGDSVNRYNVYYGGMQTPVDNDDEKKTYYYSTIDFHAPTGNISKGDIDRLLDDATDFGYYTERYIGHSGDIEATIGADYLNTVFESDFAYSSANLNVNRLKVLKIYTDENGNPVQKQVTIKIKQNGVVVGEKTGTTDANGKLELEFEKLGPGEYDIVEIIDGQEITGQGSASVSGQTINYNFSIDKAHFANNLNVNYFGTIGEGMDLDKLKTMIRKASRVDVVILTDTEADKARIDAAVESQSTGKQIDVVLNGTDPYKQYDIKNDMVRLRQLSDDLAAAQSSDTIRVINIKASEISDNGLSFDDDGRYIVLNIEMDQDTFCPYVLLDGKLLESDYGQSGKANSSKVLFNLRNTSGGRYNGLVNTNKQGAGIILAPDANAHILGGPFGGTIITYQVNRQGNELHSNNPNQIQTLNAVIQNVIGNPTTGILQLSKQFSDNTKDKVTYFTFKVRLENTDVSKINGKSFPATGLKTGDTVIFNDQGEALVQVRAGNTVAIANLPADTTYTVEEIITPETAHFQLDRYEGKEGTIEAGKTSKATVYNTTIPLNAGFVARKTVNGKMPTLQQRYNFKLDEYKNGTWANIQTQPNTGGEIKFAKVEFTEAGTYFFKIYEDAESVTDLKPDNTVYIVKVKVTGEAGNLQYETTYYEVKDPAVDTVTGDGLGTLNSSNVELVTIALFDNKDQITIKKLWANGNTGGNTEIKYTLYRTTEKPEYVDVKVTYPEAKAGAAGQPATAGTAEKTYRVMKGSELKLLLDHVWWDNSSNYSVTADNGLTFAKEGTAKDVTFNYVRYSETAWKATIPAATTADIINVTVSYGGGADLHEYMEPILEIKPPVGEVVDGYDGVSLTGSNSQGIWLTGINGLDEKDGSGNPYYYYVYEKSLNVDEGENLQRFETTYSMVDKTSVDGEELTITNRIRPTYAWVEVTKQWPDGSAEENSDSANTTIVLYRRLKGTSDRPQWYDQKIIGRASKDPSGEKSWTAGWYVLDNDYEYFIQEQYMKDSTGTTQNLTNENAYTFSSWGAPSYSQRDNQLIPLTGLTNNNGELYYKVNTDNGGTVTVSNQKRETHLRKVWTNEISGKINVNGTEYDLTDLAVTVKLRMYVDGTRVEEGSESSYFGKYYNGWKTVFKSKVMDGATDSVPTNQYGPKCYEESPWNFVWEGLPDRGVVDDKIVFYTYDAVEISVKTKDGLDLSEFFQSQSSAPGFTSIYINNTVEDSNTPKTGIKVEKKWFQDDQDITSSKSGSVTFDLYRTTEAITRSGNGGSTEPQQSNTVTLGVQTANDNMTIETASVNVVPGGQIKVTITSTDKQGDNYVYNGSIVKNLYAETVGSYGYDTSTSNKKEYLYTLPNDLSGWEYLLFNSSSKGSARVEAVGSGSGSVSPAIILREDLISISGAELVKEKITISAPDWTYTSGETLPKYVPGTETEWHYFVVEHVPTGYTDSYAIDGNELTIRNTESNDKGSLKVVKSIQPDNLNLTDDQKEKITFVIKDSSGQEISGGTFTLKNMSYNESTKRFEKEFSNLAIGTYTVTESVQDGSVPTGYALTQTTYKVSNGTTTGDQASPLVVNEDTTTVTVTNTYEDSKVGFAFSKAWLGINANVNSIQSTDLENWGSTKAISVVIKRNDPDNPADNFTLSYDIGHENGPFLPKEDRLSGEEKAIYQLTKNTNGNITTFNMGKVLEGTNSNGKPYTYYVEETTASGGTYLTYYGILSGSTVTNRPDYSHAGDGDIIINLESSGYELPSTGGPGTRLFTALGGLMTATAGAILTIRRKRKPAEG